jgi:hypothetical protein
MTGWIVNEHKKHIFGESNGLTVGQHSYENFNDLPDGKS